MGSAVRLGRHRGRAGRACRAEAPRRAGGPGRRHRRASSTAGTERRRGAAGRPIRGRAAPVPRRARRADRPGARRGRPADPDGRARAPRPPASRPRPLAPPARLPPLPAEPRVPRRDDRAPAAQSMERRDGSRRSPRRARARGVRHSRAHGPAGLVRDGGRHRGDGRDLLRPPERPRAARADHLARAQHLRQIHALLEDAGAPPREPLDPRSCEDSPCRDRSGRTPAAPVARRRGG